MSDQIDMLRKYATIKQEIKRLETEEDEMKPLISDLVLELNPDDRTVATDFGVFTIVPKRKYSYSDDIIQAEEDVKTLKKEAEAKGTAAFVEQPYLKFTSK